MLLQVKGGPIQSQPRNHKLSVSNLQAGLQRAAQGSMNLLGDVINRVTIPTEQLLMQRELTSWIRASYTI